MYDKVLHPEGKNTRHTALFQTKKCGPAENARQAFLGWPFPQKGLKLQTSSLLPPLLKIESHQGL
jgi:hypothetical protein